MSTDQQSIITRQRKSAGYAGAFDLYLSRIYRYVIDHIYIYISLIVHSIIFQTVNDRL